MAGRLRIGIVIASRDMAAWIGTCLTSLLDQTHADWTAIVVDDGSRDGTSAVLACFRDPRIRLIRQQPAGVSAARNRGRAELAGDAVLFLDADDWLAPDALARMAATLRANPHAAAVWGRFAAMRGTAEPGDPPLRVVRPRLDGDRALATLLVGNRFANGGHVLVRSAAADRAGPFDTRLRFGEDWEFWVRLALVGPFAPVPGAAPLLFVRQRASGAYRSRVTDLDAFRQVTNIIYENQDIKRNFSPRNLGALRCAAAAEQAWIAGRAMLGAGRRGAGLRLLRLAVRRNPTPRRLAVLIALHVGAVVPHPAWFQPVSAGLGRSAVISRTPISNVK